MTKRKHKLFTCIVSSQHLQLPTWSLPCILCQLSHPLSLGPCQCSPVSNEGHTEGRRKHSSLLTAQVDKLAPSFHSRPIILNMYSCVKCFQLRMLLVSLDLPLEHKTMSERQFWLSQWEISINLKTRR